MSKKNLGQKNDAQTQNAEQTQVEETKKPTEKKKREPKDKVVKVMHPALKMGANGEATVKLDDFPADFDPAKHLRLKRSNFNNEIPFLTKRAERLEKKAKEIRDEIEAIRLGGGGSAAKKIKKFTKMADQFKELMGELSDELTPEQLADFQKMFAAAAGGKSE